MNYNHDSIPAIRFDSSHKLVNSQVFVSFQSQISKIPNGHTAEREISMFDYYCFVAGVGAVLLLLALVLLALPRPATEIATRETEFEGMEETEVVNRPNVVSGKNLSPFGYRNRKEVDESDYQVVKDIYENHLRLVDGKDSRYRFVAQLFFVMRIREEDANRRVYRLTLPEISGAILPKSLRKLDALETLNLEKWTRNLPGWIGTLKSLKMLRISVQDQHSLPEEIGDLSNLEQLQVIGQTRASFPRSMSKLQNLKTMRISLEHLPEDIERLKSLQVLHVSPNIRSLPASIGNLKNLKKIDLYAARLRFLPDEIGDLTNLEILNLEYSFLRSLPRSIGNLKLLKHLNLSRMHARIALPEEIGNLTSLEDLDLSETITQASMIPLTITNLKNLRALHFAKDFHGDSSNHAFLSTLAQECPRLGCLGYEKEHARDEESLRTDLANRLMRNRINTRLFCKSSDNDEELLSKLSLWPRILKNSKSAIGPYRQCSRRSHCWGCGKRFLQSDAMFQLLVHYGGTVLESRKTNKER